IEPHDLGAPEPEVVEKPQERHIPRRLVEACSPAASTRRRTSSTSGPRVCRTGPVDRTEGTARSHSVTPEIPASRTALRSAAHRTSTRRRRQTPLEIDLAGSSEAAIVPVALVVAACELVVALRIEAGREPVEPDFPESVADERIVHDGASSREAS